MASDVSFAAYLAVFAGFLCVRMSCLTNSSTYKLSPLCLSYSCNKTDTKKVRSKLECASQCNKSESCAGFLYPHTGIYCQRLPQSCYELFTFGYSSQQRLADLDIYKNQSLIVSTRCYSDLGQTSTAIFSNQGRKDMNRAWKQYEDGFHEDMWNQWIGLKGLLAFNKMGLNNIFFNVHLKTEINGGETFVLGQYCSNFLLQDENYGYAFTIDSCTVSKKTDFLSNEYELGNAVGMSSGQPFLIPGRDNAQGCAGLAGRGWWFPDCSSGLKINPLGYRPKENLLPEMVFPGINTSDPEIRPRLIFAAMGFVLHH